MSKDLSAGHYQEAKNRSKTDLLKDIKSILR